MEETLLLSLILLCALGVVALLSEIFNFKKILYPIVIAGLLLTFKVTTGSFGKLETYFNMMKSDSFSVTFSAIIIFVSILWFIMSRDFLNTGNNKTTHHALILFSLVGAIMMVSYTNMAMLFLGIEILSIPMYVLTGTRKDDKYSNEAAFKYLIMGAFASCFLLFGIALIYGSTGSFNISEINVAIKMMEPGTIPSIYYIGILLILSAMLFKISAAPFHFWAPDVYQGAPTEVTAFMSTVVKIAAFAAFVRLFYSFNHTDDIWSSTVFTTIITIVTILTLFIGNVTAMAQVNAKRMLAYSSIAHVGFLLLAFLSHNDFSESAIMYYTIAYSMASIATFSILSIVTRCKHVYTIECFNGLGYSNPLLAGIMATALLSLAGIPPTAGFFAKYYVFTAALQSGEVVLAVLAIIASLIGVFYYFKIIIAMYFKRNESQPAIDVHISKKILLVFIAIAIIVLGLFPDFIISII
jgi:NADH-quinone oxidoreductase subunit N